MEPNAQIGEEVVGDVSSASQGGQSSWSKMKGEKLSCAGLESCTGLEVLQAARAEILNNMRMCEPNWTTQEEMVVRISK